MQLAVTIADVHCSSPEKATTLLFSVKVCVLCLGEWMVTCTTWFTHGHHAIASVQASTNTPLMRLKAIRPGRPRRRDGVHLSVATIKS
jgi:hypothetical protein